MKDKEHWTELCRQAAVEQDPKKLLLLVTEINRLLAEKQDRIGQVSKPERGEIAVAGRTCGALSYWVQFSMYRPYIRVR
jgi:hypothetical protein